MSKVNLLIFYCLVLYWADATDLNFISLYDQLPEVDLMMR